MVPPPPLSCRIPRLPHLLPDASDTRSLLPAPCSQIPASRSPLPATCYQLSATGYPLATVAAAPAMTIITPPPRPIVQAAISHPTALHLLSPVALTCCWPGLGRWNPHLVISAPTSICCPSLDHMVASTVVGAAANHLPEEQLNCMSASR